MNAPRPPRCALARVIVEPMDVDAIKTDGWKQDGILIVALDDPKLGMIDREVVRQLGNRLYGKGSHERR